MHPLLLDLRGAAELVGVTAQTTRTWALRGRIPGLRVGGSWRFWRPALLAAAAGVETGPGAGHGPAQQAPEPELVSISQLADLLGLHERTVSLLLRQGNLPGRKTGGRWRVYWPAVRDAIATGGPLPRPEADPPAGQEPPAGAPA